MEKQEKKTDTFWLKNAPYLIMMIINTFLAKILLFTKLFLKTLNGMANSVDPDQTAPSGAV